MILKLKYIMSFILLFTLTAFSQTKQEKKEQIKALKVSYITTELNLTGEQAAKFWPVYNEFDRKHFEIKHNRMRPLIKKIDEVGIDKMSDKEALNYLNQLQGLEQELFELRRKMAADLQAIIGPVKVLKLKKAEEDFNRKLLKKYKRNKD